MHPMVKPALRRGWRDLNTVQFGMTPAHAMTLGPVDTATGSFLELLNGTRALPLLREEGRRMDLHEGHVDALLDRLTGPACSTTRAAADRPLTPCARRRTSWSGCAPTSPRSP